MTERRFSGWSQGEGQQVKSERKVPLDLLVLQARQVLKDLQARKVKSDQQVHRAQTVLTALMELQDRKARQDQQEPKVRKAFKARRETPEM